MDRDNPPHSFNLGDYVYWKKLNISSWISDVLDGKSVYLRNVGYAPIKELEPATPPKIMHIDSISCIIELQNGILIYRDDNKTFQLNQSGVGVLKWH